ncbi:porin [Thalassococcus sp. CAU 1522]|uniref:Porin n=1 Tax=Thalassococcus arenae TaxID=2851652 RepID=A0ABS6N5D3_9RHOB|nr:porin [Thalassococcus arenae]MBV2358877.1 porin [Thalassococcus arenae]
MKKILFATTALVVTAGVASAEVAVTGFAELGVFKDENRVNDVTQTHTDIDVTFKMSGEADNGLTFGASFDLDEIDGGGDRTDDTQFDDATVFLSFGGAKLTVGDTDSAFDARLTETAIGDTIRDDHTVHPGYNGNSYLDERLDTQVVRFDYTFDAFTGSISVNSDDSGTLDPTWSLGVSYNAELAGLTLGVGLGYIKADSDAPGVYDEIIGLSLNTTFNNGLRAIVNYSHWSDNTSGGADDANHWGIGLGYTMNALTVSANYGIYDFDNDLENSGWGLVANYDLGGGLVAQFGAGGGDCDVVVGECAAVGDYETTYSLGLAMSF